MSRKHENFTYNYGWRTAPEQWNFYLNGKRIRLDHETRNKLACMCLLGKAKEAEDELKRLLRKEEKQKHDFVTFGFYGKNSKDFYFTKQLKAHRTDQVEKLRIYKEWKRYIVDDCNERLQPFKVTTGHITPYGNAKATEEDTSVLIDTDKRGIVIKFVENSKNKMFNV